MMGVEGTLCNQSIGKRGFDCQYQDSRLFCEYTNVCLASCSVLHDGLHFVVATSC